MEFNSQICTTKIQSERLLALGLKKETADCHYEGRKNKDEEWEVAVIGGCYRNYDFPAWSLYRLIEMLPKEYWDKAMPKQLTITFDSSLMGWVVKYNNSKFYQFGIELIDAIYNMILTLKEEGVI